MASDLTLHEQTVLISIWRLKDNAYGVAIRENFMDVTKRTLHYGTLYNTLDKFVKKGYVVTCRGEPTPERGGRSKIYYELTSKGLAALQRAKELQTALWQDIPDLTFGI